MNPSSSSSLVPFASSKRKRDPSSYDEHHRCKRTKNDVFVNYSFEDTGNNFVSHLKAALKRNIFTISDHNTLPIGLDVSCEQLKAIEDSHIYVVVFSTNYSLSIKSLDELVLILDSLSKFKNRKLFPVFLNVHPSDVRHLRGCFEEPFKTHEANVDPKRVHKWKQALKDAGGRSGQHLKNGDDEADFLQKIVQYLKKIQIPEELFDAEYPVGIEPRAQAIISKLRLGDQYLPNIVAVLGISGSGKTTIVKAVYDKIFAAFDYYCFIENIFFYKNNGPNWKAGLQRLVIRRLNGNDRFDDVGTAQIKKIINGGKALLVLDDVDKFEELEALGIPSDSLSSGSRIIVTTRNKRCLGNLPYTPYNIDLLDDWESYELFVGYAYGEDDLVDKKFVYEIVHHAGGLPLVLKVWGLHFKAHEREEWPNLLQTLKRIPHEDIQKKLRVSYDSLPEDSKSFFLDIACFFDEWNWDSMWPVLRDEDEDVENMFLHTKYSMCSVLHDEDECFFPKIEIKPLVDRGLVKIEYYSKLNIEFLRVELHEVIKEMGKEVVRQENKKDPGQRTRLVDRRDVLHVLENNSGTNSVESIKLDGTNSVESIMLDGIPLQVDAFKKMNNLRFIQILNCNNYFYSSSNDDTSLSFKHLKYLEWDEFPLRSINIDMGNVVVIKMPDSKLEILWEGFKNLKKLRILDVSGSKSLIRTGSFIGLENLEELDLSHCHNLIEVDSSIVCLQKLLLLELTSCINIKSLPNLPPNIEAIYGARCESLVCLPLNMSHLHSLENLVLKSCSNIKSIPNLPRSIKKILASECRNLVNLPSNMFELHSVTSLSLAGHVNLGSEGLMKVTGLRKLQHLNMRDCNVSEVSSEIGNLESLQMLCLSGNKFSSLPDSFSSLSQLVHLQINDCHELQYLPLLPSKLAAIEATECSSLDVMPFDSMRKANIFHSKLFEESFFPKPLWIGLSWKEVPDLFQYKGDRGNVLSFVAPEKKICGAILYGSQINVKYDSLAPKMLNRTKATSYQLNNLHMNVFPTNVIICPLNETTLVVESGDTVEVIFQNYESYGFSLICEGDVVDSTLVMQNRNDTHEHTYPVPSQVADDVRSFIQNIEDDYFMAYLNSLSYMIDYWRWDGHI